MPKKRFNTCKTWEGSMQRQNKEFISIKYENLILWKELEGKQSSRKRFEANVIKLKMEFRT